MILAAYDQYGYEVSYDSLKLYASAMKVRIVAQFIGKVSLFMDLMEFHRKPRLNFDGCNRFPSFEGFVIKSHSNVRRKLVTGSWLWGKGAMHSLHPAYAWQALAGGYHIDWLKSIEF